MIKAKEVLKEINEIEKLKAFNKKDIWLAKTREGLNEASLGRIYQHFLNSKKTSFGIVTSWRDILTIEENRKNFKSLIEILKQNKLGFIHLTGHGQEKDEYGKLISVKEPSLFIIGISLDLITKIAKKFNQFAFVFSGNETNGETTFFVQEEKTKEYKEDQKFKEFHPNKISQFYSTVKGKPFIFEYKDQENWFEGVAKQSFEKKYGKRNLEGIDY